MNEININLPAKTNDGRNLRYLSDFHGFGDMLLPYPKLILNKATCACGATEFFLRNDWPIIVAVPRKYIIETKVAANPTPQDLLSGNIPNYHRNREVWYFDRSDDTISMRESKKRLEKYLSNTLGLFDFVPKIIVTYDSFIPVCETLYYHGCLDSFTVVVDEFTTLVSDAKMKNEIGMHFFDTLNSLNNRTIYVSATPLKEYYLENIPEFASMPYMMLNWDKSCIEKAQFYPAPMTSVTEVMKHIITDFRHKGYFNQTKVNGQTVNSTEGVFYINSIDNILRVIKQNRLTPDETLVLCARQDDNEKRLAAVGHSIGSIPSFDEYRTKNKTFTFVTNACTVGADMYSDLASIFVFGDSNKENLSLDISIDLPQIAGRCRSEGNPFKNNIPYYFKKSSTTTIEEAQGIIERRLSASNTLMELFANQSDESVLDTLRAAQSVRRYSTNYINLDKQNRPSFNRFAYIDDLHKLEIKRYQHVSEFSVNYFVDSNCKWICDEDSERLYKFNKDFHKDCNFERRMKLYVNTITAYPHLREAIEANSSIPLDYKDYFMALGADRIAALGYKEASIKREASTNQALAHTGDLIVQRLAHILKPYHTYTNRQVKDAIAQVYAELNIDKAAKANAILMYFDNNAPCQAIYTKINDADGKRVNGFRIVRKG